MPEHDLLIVDTPTIHPGRCIVSHAYEDPRGFIDTGQTPAEVDPRIYLSISWIWNTCQKLGFFDTVTESLRRDLHNAREENKELNRQLAAIDVLEQSNFNVRKRRGRPAGVK